MQSIFEAIDVVEDDVFEFSELGPNAKTASINQQAKVIQTNYVLNDSAALKKKMRNETNRKDPYTVGEESKNGSNVVILLKTSFFEYVKTEYIKELHSNCDIFHIGNATVAKAASQSGDAFVEYALELKFKANGHTHEVKITAFATTCKIMIQQLGEKPSFHTHLGNRSVPRYFADVFLLPWCESAYAKKTYIESDLIESIRKKIIQLYLGKADKKCSSGRTRLSSVPSSDARCVSRSCKYKGINLNNKVAVGVCSACGMFEHFDCSKTKEEDRNQIMKGKLKYYCSECFSKNAAAIAFEGSVESETRSPKSIKSSACPDCTFVSDDTDVYARHRKDNHEHLCGICSEIFNSDSTLNEHMEKEHKKVCSICDSEFRTSSQLNDHYKSEHGPYCTSCERKFDSKDDLQQHINSDHGKPNNSRKGKSMVNKRANEEESVASQNKQNFSCQLCDTQHPSQNELDNHIHSKHTFKCSFCNIAVNSSLELSSHIQDKHSIPTPQNCCMCDKDFDTKDELKEHMTKEHSSLCNVCGEKFQSTTQLRDHITICKLRQCDF